jgi:hypothetical protein
VPQVDVADNVSLISIVQEYEDGFEARYGKRPKLVRQLKDQVGRRVGGGKGARRSCAWRGAHHTRCFHERQRAHVCRPCCCA